MVAHHDQTSCRNTGRFIQKSQGFVDLDTHPCDEAGIRGPWPPAWPAGQLRRQFFRDALVHQRLIERSVDVHRTGVDGIGRDRHAASDGGAPVLRSQIASCFHIDGEPGERSENPTLRDDLICADVPKSIGAIRCEHHERNSRLMRLNHGGKKIRHRGPGCRHNRSRNTRRLPETECHKSGDPLVDAHVETDVSSVLRGREGEGKGG